MQLDSTVGVVPRGKYLLHFSTPVNPSLQDSAVDTGDLTASSSPAMRALLPSMQLLLNTAALNIRIDPSHPDGVHATLTGGRTDPAAAVAAGAGAEHGLQANEQKATSPDATVTSNPALPTLLAASFFTVRPRQTTAVTQSTAAANVLLTGDPASLIGFEQEAQWARQLFDRLYPGEVR